MLSVEVFAAELVRVEDFLIYVDECLRLVILLVLLIGSVDATDQLGFAKL